MKVMITGAFGFLGRRLITELEERGHDLLLLDQSAPEEATLYGRDFTEKIKSPVITKWPHVKAGITDADAVVRAMQGRDAVIHLAAIPSGYPEQGLDIMRVNVTGTYNILDAARLAGVSRAVCASSINAFGTFYWRLSGKPVEYKSMPLDETFDPVPEDPYSLSKLCNELTCAAFSRAYGLTTAALRFAGVWTPSHQGVVRRSLPVGSYSRHRHRHPAGPRGADPADFWGLYPGGRRYAVPRRHHGTSRKVST